MYTGAANSTNLATKATDAAGDVGATGGSILFVNLVDKKKEQGALGETFDSALRIVASGAGSHRQNQTDGATADGGGDGVPPDRNSELAKAAVEDGAAATSAGTAPTEKGEASAGTSAGTGLNLVGSLRHVWFDFHHEVRQYLTVDRVQCIFDNIYSSTVGEHDNVVLRG